LVAVTAALAVAGGLPGAGPAAAAPAPTGPILAAPGTAVPGSYVVVLKDRASGRSGTAQTAAALTASYGGQVSVSWQRALRGFAARMSDGQAAQLAADPRVASVQQDGYVHLAGTQPNPPSWGLDRIDQRNLPLNNSYTYPATAGGVHAYIIDTGIRTTHTTFGGRASWGADFIDGTNTDCNGHGTHVAGTVGGAQYGVAKAVALVAVRVLDCAGSGTFAQVISGVDWVAGHAVHPAVANMSLGGGAFAALDTAVRNAIGSGVTFAVAAGNSGADACGFSPARVAEAITVNATDRTDTRPSFSNFGTCTDIFAPGVAITSAWNSGDTATNTISGTSMASPHVAGAAALWLALHPADSPAQVASGLLAAATPNVVTNPGPGSPNRLLFVGFAAPAPAGYQVAFQANTSNLWTVGTGGTGDLQLGMMAGTSPSISRLTGGGYEIAFQANTGNLWVTGTAGTADLHLGMMAGTSPSITALSGGGYEVAFQANTGNLWVTGTAGTADLHLGMRAGTSPGITGLPGGGYQVAFQANTGNLWVTGSAGTADLHLGMMAATSPGIAALATGGYEVAFQANTGNLWVTGTAGTADLGLGMRTGTSPSITGLTGGGYEVAFQANTGNLWVTGTAGTADLQLGMANGTSPSIAALATGGYEVAFQANSTSLWVTGTAGTADLGLGMRAGTSPSIRPAP
jgi:subtilisin family serine protease